MKKTYKAYIIAVLLAVVVVAVIFFSGILDKDNTQQNQPDEQETIRILEAKREQLIEFLNSDSRIIVYFNENADKNYILKVQQALEQKQNIVQSVSYRSSEQATQEFREALQHDTETIQALDELLAQGIQALPSSLIIEVHRDNFNTLTTELEGTLDPDSHIDEISYSSRENLITRFEDMDFDAMNSQTLEALELLLEIWNIGNVDNQTLLTVWELLLYSTEYQQVQPDGQSQPVEPITPPISSEQEPEQQAESDEQPEPTQNQEQPQESAQQFSSCAEAKKAGYKNLTKQQVDQFGIKTRDGDGDGVYCE